MKYFLTALIITILVSGCATRNAFSKLDISQEQEIATEQTRSGKIMNKDKVDGIFSAIYLNNVYGKTDAKTNNFYISMYLKNKNNDLNITMNNERPLKIKKLEEENNFSHLLPMKTSWTSNYVLAFENNESLSTLTLQIDNGQSSSGPLSYSKDQ